MLIKQLTLLQMWFSVLLVSVPVSVMFSHSMCPDDIKIGLGS